MTSDDYKALKVLLTCKDKLNEVSESITQLRDLYVNEDIDPKQYDHILNINSVNRIRIQTLIDAIHDHIDKNNN